LTAANLPDLLTCAEAAALLKVKPPKLRALANRGEIAFYRVGKSMLFADSDLESFLAECRRPARGEKALEKVLAG
jgi:excisionase family DNA binding protein